MSVVFSQQSINTSRGPAFFSSSAKGSLSDAAESNLRTNTTNKENKFDPAMCPLELCVQSSTVTLPTPTSPAAYADLMSTSISNRFTSPTAYQKLLRRQQHRLQKSATESSFHNHQTMPQLRESTIFLKIDYHVYQMDLSHVENVDVQSGERDKQASIEEDSKHESCWPPSLLIQFGNSCIFRIFSMTGVAAENLSTLQGVHNLLLQLLTADGHVPSEFPHPYFKNNALLASPAGSSTTACISSSQEPGQRDYSRPTETPPSHVSDDRKPSATSMEGSGDKAGSSSEVQGGTPGPWDDEHQETTKKAQAELQVDERAHSSPSTNLDQFSTIRIRQATYEQSKRDLASLYDLLRLPSTSVGTIGRADHEKRRRVLQVKANELLNFIPERLAASYCTQSQLQEAILKQNERIFEYELELDALVNTFWPAPTRSAGANGPHGGLSSRQSSTVRRPQIKSSECVQRANDILQKRKDAIEEKLALACLPTRGS